MDMDPGCTRRHGYAKSFNGRFRRERLNRELLHALSKSRVVLELWQYYYDHQRSHRSSGLQTAARFNQTQGATPSLLQNLGVEQNSKDKQRPAGILSLKVD
jgi:transposase InsO family protein